MPTLHNRHSFRLLGYDYSLAGAYFLTIVIHNRQNLLGEIQGETVLTSRAGQIVHQTWAKLPQHYPAMESVAFTMMPNHVHAIVLIKEMPARPLSLTEIVRAFKSFSARRINLMRSTPGEPVWQRDYFEHVIRSDAELERLFTYTIDNPRRWAEDKENLNLRG